MDILKEISKTPLFSSIVSAAGNFPKEKCTSFLHANKKQFTTLALNTLVK